MNWVELKEFVQQSFNETNDLQVKNAFEEVLNKMAELEKEDTFVAFTDQDGFELIESKSEEGVMVWTQEQPNNKYKLKVKKIAVLYQDEETGSYDCDPNGIEIVEQLKF